MSESADRYRIVGPIYDALTVVASGSAITRCRLAALDHMQPGDRVLFVGPGHGTDVAAAAAAGMQVTVVERSATMVARLNDTLQRRAPAAADDVTVIHGDAFDHDRADYDVVVANFFLNVFPTAGELRMRHHLEARVRPGGVLVIGDFAAINRPWWLRAIATLHWYAALVTFRILTHNAIRPMTDHTRVVVDDGLAHLATRSFRVLGLPLYASLAFRRDG